MSFVRTYDAEQRPKGWLRHVLPLAGYPAVVWRNRYLVHNFFRRDLLGRWHGSFLGAGWMLVQPMVLFAVYFLVFGVLYGDVRRGQGPDIAYALYLFSGVLVFHAMIEATSTCCMVVVANGNLVKKVAFPSEVLPIPPVMVSLVIYLVGAVVCLATGLLSGAMQPGLLLLALPLLLVIQFAMTLGIGLLLANAYVFIRDVVHVWRIVATVWMFLSPVFWYPTLFRDKMPDSIVPGLIADLNPLYPLMLAHRIALGGEQPGIGLVDFWGHTGVAAAWAAGLLVLGFASFASSKHRYADVV